MLPSIVDNKFTYVNSSSYAFTETGVYTYANGQFKLLDLDLYGGDSITEITIDSSTNIINSNTTNERPQYYIWMLNVKDLTAIDNIYTVPEFTVTTETTTDEDTGTTTETTVVTPITGYIYVLTDHDFVNYTGTIIDGFCQAVTI